MSGFESFVAARLSKSKNKSFTRIIIRIAVCSVALSIATMILTNATITGFKTEIKEKVFGFWGHIHIRDLNISRSFDAIPISMDQDFMDSLAHVQQIQYQDLDQPDPSPIIESSGGISSIDGFAVLPAIIKMPEFFEPVLLKGIHEDYHWDFLKSYIKRGDVIGYPKDEPSDDIIVSEQMSQKLGIKLNQNIILGFIQDRNIIKRKFKIQGIYKTGLEEYDNRFALIDLREIQQLLKWDSTEVSGIEIRIDDIADLDLMEEYINFEVLPSDVSAESIKSAFPSIFDWLELQDINEEVISFLVIIIAIVNMITALLILILDRTQMIGIFKSLGATDWSIRKIFLHYAFYIILWGIFFGNVIGLLFCYLQKRFGFIKLDESNYYLSTAPIQINWDYILMINVLSAILILLVLVIPTFLISRIEPVKSLKFE